MRSLSNHRKVKIACTLNLENKMFIDPFLARSLSRQHMAQWVADGDALHDELRHILSKFCIGLDKGRSPSKIINKLSSELTAFFENKPVDGSISEPHGRRLEFSLRFPEMTEDGLVLSVVYGQMNGRTGKIDIKMKRPMSISCHALDRLHQRIGTVESKEVLKEIYTTLGHCEAFSKAGKLAGATCWPLLSTNGFFVAVPTEIQGVGSLVTYMSFDQLSRKWGMVAHTLREIAANRSELLNDVDFCVEFLRSYPWMLNPHRPGFDKDAIVWNQNGSEQIKKTIDNSSVTIINSQEVGDVLERQDMKSIDFIPGLNYLTTSLPFKVQSRFEGIVVQIQHSGNIIVGLRNGWVGILPAIAIKRAHELVDGLKSLAIGDEVSVEIRNINKKFNENACALSLDLTEKVDAEWQIYQKNYSNDMVVEGLIFKVLEHCCYLRFADGAIAELPKKELYWPCDLGFDQSIIAVGNSIRVKITGVREDKRILWASLRQLTENRITSSEISDQQWQQIQEDHPNGEIVVGKVMKVNLWGLLVVLNDGATGVVPTKQLSWSTDVKEIDMEGMLGKLLTLKIIGTKENKKQLTFSYREVIAHPVENPDLCPKVGCTYSGIVTNTQTYGAFVKLPAGIEGLLHVSELRDGLSLEIGQNIDVLVKGVDIEKRRVSLALR